MCPCPCYQAFSAMLTDVFTVEDVGIELHSRIDGGFYKLQRLKADTKVMLEILRYLLFVSDRALCASSERQTQSLPCSGTVRSDKNARF